MASTFPNFPDKHSHDAIIEPAEIARMTASQRTHPVPEAAILTYAGHLTRTVAARPGVVVAEGYGTPLRRLHIVDGIGIATDFGIGSPAAAMVTEDLIALGVRRIVNIGLAGGLQRHCGIGEIVVCTDAIRDEGVSHHYLPPGHHARPSAALTERLGAALGEPLHHGATWTIDAPYRETVAEARHYQEQGVLTVEMEAAAVFAVASYRGAEAAAAFAISDSLAELVWNPRFGTPEVVSGLDRLLDAALVALRQ